MFGKIFTVFVILLLAAGVALAEDPKKNQKHMTVLTPEMEAAWEAKIAAQTETKGPISVRSDRSIWSDVVGETGYDYGTNSVTGRMIDLTSGGNAHIVFMKRLNDAADPRYVTYNYADNGLSFMWGEGSMDESLGTTGWGRVHSGDGDAAYIVNHGGGTWLYADAGEANYAFANVHGDGGFICDGNFPGFAWSSNGTIHYICDSNASSDPGFIPDTYMYSTDGGVTFTAGIFPENPLDPTYLPGNVEIWPVVNPASPDEVSFAATWEDPADPTNLPGGLMRYTSNDNGTSWTVDDLYMEDVWQPTGNGDEIGYYLVQNFSQLNNMYSDNGTFHIAFNGYGLVDVDGDTSTAEDTYAIFPVVYWNDANGEFVEVTDPAIGHSTVQEFSDIVLAGYPGNGIGNAYPTMATYGESTVVCMWQGIEVGEDGLPILINDIDGNPTAFYGTDIYMSYSHDGGANWEAPLWVAGRSEMSDAFPVLAREAWLNEETGNLEVAYVYFQDADPGVSLFANNGVFAHGEWWYGTMEFAATGIEPLEDQVAKSFNLKQNYPNPFNPTTTIAFEIAQAADVTLEIFNVTGENVGTLVNEHVTSGVYEVQFDASEFASGVYFYTLTAGNLTQTKKMVLMK